MPGSLRMAAVSVTALAGAGFWIWSMYPGAFGSSSVLALVIPVLWGFLELAHVNRHGREWVAIMRLHRLCIAWISLMLLFSIAAKLALVTGAVDAAWAPSIRRARGIVLGASMMAWGNFLPKLLSPWNVEGLLFEWLQVHRFVGWTVFLAGLVEVLVWLAVPLEDARAADRIIFISAGGLAFGRKLLSLIETPAARQQRGSDS